MYLFNMVYITNKNFFEKYLKWMGNQHLIVDNLEIIKKLLKKYWKLLHSTKFVDRIKDVSEDTFNLIEVLKISWKLNIIDASSLIKYICTNDTLWEKKFIISWSNSNCIKKAQDSLKEKYSNIDLEVWDLSSLWVYIKGDWKYFKKTLDWDLSKLLW